jgi:hypothetical protein
MHTPSIFLTSSRFVLGEIPKVTKAFYFMLWETMTTYNLKFCWSFLTNLWKDGSVEVSVRGWHVPPP